MIFHNSVSLLCILSKVFEKVMHFGLFKFLKTLEIFYQHQFGFRKHILLRWSSWIKLTKKIKPLKMINLLLGVCIDFPKAFDTKNHKILSKKLRHRGMRRPVRKWSVSYTEGLSQYGKCNGVEFSKQKLSNVMFSMVLFLGRCYFLCIRIINECVTTWYPYML